MKTNTFVYYQGRMSDGTLRILLEYDIDDHKNYLHAWTVEHGKMKPLGSDANMIPISLEELHSDHFNIDILWLKDITLEEAFIELFPEIL